jgi:membrane fusion protein (multidrug efflux system)
MAGIFAWTPQHAHAQGDAPKVVIAAVYSEEVTQESRFIGRGEAIDKVDILARVSGFVEEITVEDGAEVTEGDLLFRIESETYEANLAVRRAELAGAEAALELAGIELIRKAELLARGSSPESERDIARANKLSAEAAVKSAQAGVTLAEIELGYT